MPNKKLTDNEIKKGLEDTLHRIKGAEHLIVPKLGVENLCNGLENALDLINRLQAELEGLREIVFTDRTEAFKLLKAEAYKECVEKVKKELSLIRLGCQNLLDNEGVFAIDLARKQVDNLLKELVGEDNESKN